MQPSDHFVPGVAVRPYIKWCLLVSSLLGFQILVLRAAAESTFGVPAPSPALRYHYGDNPGWANPKLDDSSWPLSANEQFPAPAFSTDGFFWVRTLVAVPPDRPPFAIQSALAASAADVVEVFVNGVRVGQYGAMPPHSAPRIQPQILVFDIPRGVAAPGSEASVALRCWTIPPNRDRGPAGLSAAPFAANLKIGRADLLRAIAGETQARFEIRYAPQFAVAFVFVGLGVVILGFGVWSRSRELELCAIWLVIAPLFLSFIAVGSLAAGADLRTLSTIFEVVNGIGMAVALELLWTVQGFRHGIFLQIGRACWLIETIGRVLMSNLGSSGPYALAVLYTGDATLFAFNIFMTCANVVALAGRGRNRPVAAVMILINIGYFLRVAGAPLSFGFLPLDFFQASFYLSVFAVAAVLMQQTWKRWREGDDLRIEFAAAREVQQQLVPTEIPKVTHLRMGSAYLPAKEVGGDFYQVLELCNGVTLILLGDVSGKGLKAAMTGMLTIGAAHALATETCDPSTLLERLNREVCRLRREGFVTCLCATITTGGLVTMANAGHLSPYRNRDELPVESGLPLGMIPSCAYPATTIQLSPGDTLTMLSDGVVEAQSASGELFGFDRTRDLMQEPAAAIAEAARAYGQSDDITVLTLTFVPAEVRA